MSDDNIEGKIRAWIGRHPDATLEEVNRYARAGNESALYTLYLLGRHGREWEKAEFFENAFLRAFPMVLSETRQNDFLSPEKCVRSAYTHRNFYCFLRITGLCSIRKKGDVPFTSIESVRTLPLFDELVGINP